MQQDREIKAAEEHHTEDAAVSPIRIKSMSIENQFGESGTLFRTGDDLHIRVQISSDISSQPIHLMAGVLRAADELQCFAVGTHSDGLPPLSGQSEYEIVVKLHALPLLRGDYAVVLFVGDENAMHVFDRRDLRPAFSVSGDRYEIGMIAVSHEWEIERPVVSLATSLSS
jgi:hypothetical protein